MAKGSKSVMRGEKTGIAKATKNVNLRALNAALTKELRRQGVDLTSGGFSAARRKQNAALVGAAKSKTPAPKPKYFINVPSKGKAGKK